MHHNHRHITTGLLSVGLGLTLTATVAAVPANAQAPQHTPAPLPSVARTNPIQGSIDQAQRSASGAATAAEVAVRNLPYEADGNRGSFPDDSVHWIDRTATSKIVIVAPHSVKHHRAGQQKETDTYTGGIAETLADRVGASVLTATGEVSDWGDNWDHRDDDFARALHSLPQDSIIVDLHGMNDSAKNGDISLGTSKKNSETTQRLTQRIQDSFAGKTTVNRKFPAKAHYTTTHHMQERGMDAIQVELSEQFRDPAQLRVGEAVGALQSALSMTEKMDR